MELNEKTTINVLDPTGRLIMHTNANGRYNLDMSTQPTGTYTLQLLTETGIGVKRILKY
jgi:hypothetical protein